MELTFDRILSLIALVISIISPFVVYYLLDPAVQTFKNRGRLQLIPQSPIIEIPRAETLLPGATARVKENWPIEVKNIGNLPVKEVLIIADFGHQIPENPQIEIDPPSPFETRVQDRTFTIELKRQIPVGGSTTIMIAPMPERIWFYNEQGDMTMMESPKGTMGKLGIEWPTVK